MPDVVTDRQLMDLRVLSIQSHVVHGTVGNKSATFPLQVLGFEVDAVNSVQFSNHTGYKNVAGQVLNADDLSDLFSALKNNDLHRNYSHVLSGYIGSASFAERVYDVVKEVKSANPAASYVCDPVLGDLGKMYVPEEILPIYKNKIMKMADVLTPNQFEAELLTGVKIATEADAVKAMDLLHDDGIPVVIISSTELGDRDHLTCMASKKVNEMDTERIKIHIPRLAANFTGTGDLFTALVMAWLAKSNNDLKLSIEKAISTMQSVLQKTYNFAEKKGRFNNANLELKLIECKSEIENPILVARSENI